MWLAGIPVRSRSQSFSALAGFLFNLKLLDFLVLLLNFSLLRFDVFPGLLIGDLNVLPLRENYNQKA